MTPSQLLSALPFTIKELNAASLRVRASIGIYIRTRPKSLGSEIHLVCTRTTGPGKEREMD